MLRFAAIFGALLLLPLAPTSAAMPPPLRVGVEYVPPAPAATDFRLYTPEGLDLVLAERIAVRLGRQLELVQVDPLTDSSEDGIDVALLRHRGQWNGREAIPTGFASGLGVSMRTDTDIRSWRDLAGRTVCVSRGNKPAATLARDNGALLRVEDAPAKSLVLVRTGVCDAAVHDAALLQELFHEEGWQKFAAGLPESPALELAAFVDARNTSLAEAVRSALSGNIPDLKAIEKRWARNVALEVYLDQDAPDCH